MTDSDTTPDTPEPSRKLSDLDIEVAKRSLELLDRLGDAVGGWGFKSAQCRLKSVTMTLTFDNEVGPVLGHEFIQMMEKCPALLGPYIRRILEIDAELKARLHD